MQPTYTDAATAGPADAVRMRTEVERYRARRPDADAWAAGYGVIRHSVETQARVFAMARALEERGVTGDGVPLFELLSAADRLANAGMWLVVHQAYTRHVYLDGRELGEADFKPNPEGHVGGSLNMVPAYTGYLAANAISGFTRSWLMGQGHCVAAIDSVNVLVDNMEPEHAERYGLSDEGLTRFVRDFYAFRLDEHGRQDSPLGSHVNVYTAGGIAEGGYLGFSELQYVHMPLPGERLVVFLSDGAFEEQRGSDWVPRWWRAEDSGLAMPFMINNGRRIDQRTTMSQQGGVDWFLDHLRLNGFDPFVIDGRDPAAFTWGILEMEARLEALTQAVAEGLERYPLPLPYGIAVAPKGAGFANEGTNLAHNLPLLANPHIDLAAAQSFNQHARRLWVAPPELREALARFQQHGRSGRARERDHPLARRDPPEPVIPDLEWRPLPADRAGPAAASRFSPMRAVDAAFLAIVQANPGLRPRVGNPDEMRSNRLQRTLDTLEFRVSDPEPGLPEGILGAVVTALNEEAVAAAALGNKGGINLVATYEAFGTKMHGVVRQELIFAAHQVAAGRPPRWLSVPLVLTSHTWENNKNEQSHQDPSMAEAMLGEAAHVSRVVFVPDANTALATFERLFRTRGQIWSVVIPKKEVPDLFGEDEARRLVEQGALDLEWAGHRRDEAQVVLAAAGAYQLGEVLRASRRLAERDVPHRVAYLYEPARFRTPRDRFEAAHAVTAEQRDALFPPGVPARVFLGHTRPDVLGGVIRPLDTGPARTGVLGFINHGGTLSIGGLLFINRSTWAHVLLEAVRVLERPPADILDPEEIEALEGRRSPHGVIVEPAPET